MYIARHIEKTIEKSFAAFPAVLITGPRQVGKSTPNLMKQNNRIFTARFIQFAM